MKSKISLQSVYKYSRLTILPALCWPPPLGSSASIMRRHNYLWWIPYFVVLSTELSLLYSLFINIHDLELVLKIFGEICSLTSINLKMVVSRINQPRLQILIAEIEAFLVEAKPEENEFIQRYIDECVQIYVAALCSGIITATTFSLAPAITSQILPADGAFPFSIEPTWVWACLYILQSMTLVLLSCTINLDLMNAMFIWYGIAKFDMLAQELQRATNAHDVRLCVQKHQKLLEFVDHVKAVVRFSIAFIAMLTVFAAIGGGFAMINRASLFEMLKFALMVLVPTSEVWLYAWPADRLMEAARKFGDAAYGCNWIGNSPEMFRDVQIIIHRSQIPNTIRVNGILAGLSLEFFGSMVTATLSYFTTLRAITAEDD